jgi:hypothetical protein
MAVLSALDVVSTASSSTGSVGCDAHPEAHVTIARKAR